MVRGRTSSAVQERGGGGTHGQGPQARLKLGVTHGLLDDIRTRCDPFGTNGDDCDQVIGIEQPGPAYVIEVPKGIPIRGKMGGPCDVEGSTLINLASGNATNKSARGAPIMLKGMTLSMFEAKTYGGNVKHQRGETLQSTVCFASNSAKVIPYLEGELGSLPEDTRGMVCERTLQKGGIKGDTHEP